MNRHRSIETREAFLSGIAGTLRLHVHVHTAFIMSAFTMTSAKAFAAPKLGRSTARRGPVVVRAEKVSHGKGGEEGGATFNNDAFGMVAKNANYMLFATAVTKVRPVIPTAIHDAIDPARETRARRPGARSDDPPSSTSHVESREIRGSRDVRFSP
jgi:hypothetical protein